MTADPKIVGGSGDNGVVTTVMDDTRALALVSNAELQECLRHAEVELRQAYARMLDVVAEAENRTMARAEGFRDSAAMLARMLRISATEARTRVEHAAQLGPRRATTGQPLPVLLPAAAAALRAGQLGTGQLRVITATMALLGASVTPQQRQQIENDLVEHARTFEPHRLAILARRIRDRLDPDGPPPPEPAPMAGACGELRLRDRRDGGLGLEGWLDAETGAQFRNLIAQFARPRPASENIPDQRSVTQRQADALAELCGLAASAREMPHNGGEPPHLNVTLDLESLRAAIGAATLDYGQQLTPAQYRRLACDSKLVPVVLGGPSEPLDVGRTRRSVPLGIRRALIIRDGGCSFPGCDRPPSRCDCHHVIHWADGGETSVDNCVLLCPMHHREVHHTGWELTIQPDRVEFIPPAILDLQRKPLTNPLRQ